MRKLFAGATFLLVGVGAASNAAAAGAPLGLKGSDTLEDVSRSVISSCLGSGPLITTYSGGGSGGGETAMFVNPTQQIAPMSRELSTATVAICNLGVDVGCHTACVVPTDAGCTGAAPTNGKRFACDSTLGNQEVLIGLDGIAVVGANQSHGDSLEKTVTPPGGPDDHTDDCGDVIAGGQFVVCGLNVDPGCTVACTVGTDAGCTGAAGIADGKYIFADWRDVLAVVYGGQYHSDKNGAVPATTVVECTTTALGNPAYCGTGDGRYNPAAATHKVRNPDRMNCMGTVRKNLVNQWGNLFADKSEPPFLKCRTAACKELKHAFRRGDLSGTSDTFVGLVGMIAIQGFTKTLSPTSTTFPGIDSAATSSAFCNAGDGPQNKGDSDYLDLDPIRRIVDSDIAGAQPVGSPFPGLRGGFEQVAEGHGLIVNPGPPAGPAATRNDYPATVLTDKAWSNFQNVGVDTSIAGGFAGPWGVAQQAALTARKGLGVVIPVEIPTNYGDDQVMYWSPSPAPGQAPVVCQPGVSAPTLLGANIMCPDGSGPNLCLLPVDASGTNFNCMSARAVPAVGTSMSDARVYNLLVVNSAGKFVKDNYLNANLTLTAARQNRVVSAYFRLHTTQVTPLDGGLPTVAANPTGVCKNVTSTDQIGCLVRANPCSLGFAGRESVDLGNLSMAFQIGLNGNTSAAAALPASTHNIENKIFPPAVPYSIARTLWVNAYAGIASVSNIEICSMGVDPNCTTACVVGTDTGCTGVAPKNGKFTSSEKDLLGCFGSTAAPGTAVPSVDGPVGTFNFVVVPPFRICNQGVDVGCATACVAGTDAGCTGVAPANGKYVVTRQKTCLATFP